eukprot:m.270619 g.270619  ORF g.270619 m.270619 type:complete len:181 (-) comp90792_c0_seq1:1084-1626(-)
MLVAVVIALSVPLQADRPKFHFTPRFGWTNDPNGLNFAKGSDGNIVQHLFYQANPNSTSPPWSAPWAPAYWGHATSPDLVHWTEVVPSAIRGGSGAIVPLSEKMQTAADGVTAIAFDSEGGGIGFWTSRDADQLYWHPPVGCTDAGPATSPPWEQTGQGCGWCLQRLAVDSLSAIQPQLG